MDLDPELAREWIRRADKLVAALERLPRQSPDSVATHAGNIVVRVEESKTPRALAIAVCSTVLCAVLSIITLLGGGMLYLNMKDHLDAIYMMAPQLKPEPEPVHVDHHPDAATQEHQHRIK